ncbi:hypothetical protein COEU31_19800 [Coprococcus eutactus]|uniref:Uncharacterized protein n=1 Tax=Coprococcus eutactus TaxID=33043 RepID=A0AAI9K5P8_9FIRM|nr:hypothetical protein COEU31_19800 [Coprococcus eutactus]
MSSCYILSDLHIDRWNYGWTVGDGGGMYIKMGGQQIFSNYGTFRIVCGGWRRAF